MDFEFTVAIVHFTTYLSLLATSPISSTFASLFFSWLDFGISFHPTSFLPPYEPPLCFFSCAATKEIYVSQQQQAQSAPYLRCDFKTNSPEYAKLNASKARKTADGSFKSSQALHKRCMQIKMPNSKPPVKGSIASTSGHPDNYDTIMVMVSKPWQCWITSHVV